MDVCISSKFDIPNVKLAVSWSSTVATVLMLIPSSHLFRSLHCALIGFFYHCFPFLSDEFPAATREPSQAQECTEDA